MLKRSFLIVLFILVALLFVVPMNSFIVYAQDEEDEVTEPEVVEPTVPDVPVILIEGDDQSLADEYLPFIILFSGVAVGVAYIVGKRTGADPLRQANEFVTMVEGNTGLQNFIETMLTGVVPSSSLQKANALNDKIADALIATTTELKQGMEKLTTLAEGIERIVDKVTDGKPNEESPPSSDPSPFSR